jgi:hypothetical protein
MISHGANPHSTSSSCQLHLIYHRPLLIMCVASTQRSHQWPPITAPSISNRTVMARQSISIILVHKQRHLQKPLRSIAFLNRPTSTVPLVSHHNVPLVSHIYRPSNSAALLVFKSSTQHRTNRPTTAPLISHCTSRTRQSIVIDHQWRDYY